MKAFFFDIPDNNWWWSCRAEYERGQIIIYRDKITGEGKPHAFLLRKFILDLEAAKIPADSSEVFTAEQAGVVFKASPNNSHGYMYMVAYEPETLCDKADKMLDELKQ